MYYIFSRIGFQALNLFCFRAKVKNLKICILLTGYENHRLYWYGIETYTSVDIQAEHKLFNLIVS